MLKVIEFSPGVAIETNDTFEVGYPTGVAQADVENETGHYFITMAGTFNSPSGFTAVFGAESVTVTYLGTTTIPQGETIYFNLDIADT